MDALLDTSFLVAAMENKIDVTAELRKFGRPCIFVLDLVINELNKLSEGRGSDAANARVALDFLRNANATVIKAQSGNTDNKIIEYSMNRNMVVCTIDREMRDRLVRGGMEVITIRQGRYLARAE